MGVPSGLECYTWPDGTVTQTFDPQSPPCVASWPEQARGNGGATSQGVSATTIRLAVEKSSYADSVSKRLYDDVARFFSTRFEFYGRQFQWIPYESASGDIGSPEVQRSSGVAAASAHPFASDAFEGYAQEFFADTLAQRGVITVADLDMTSAELASHSPYEWNYGPTLEQTLTTLGTFACTSLAGKRAQYAASPQNASTRKFAIVRSARSESSAFDIDPSPLRRRLSGCGLTNVQTVTLSGSTTDGTEEAAMVDLKRQGVTTVINLTDASQSQGLPLRADEVGYSPEWLFCGCRGQYSANYQLSPSDHVFGLAPLDKQLPAAQSMGWLAVHSVDPQLAPTDLPVTWQAGRINALYKRLLVLASGIQTAGPRLTPRTFHQGLSATRFPDPGAGTRPYYQARVGFGAGPVMVQDFAVWWLDSSQNDAVTGRVGGGMCWASRGQRWEDRNWPRGIKIFAGPCR